MIASCRAQRQWAGSSTVDVQCRTSLVPAEERVGGGGGGGGEWGEGGGGSGGDQGAANSVVTHYLPWGTSCRCCQ